MSELELKNIELVKLYAGLLGAKFDAKKFEDYVESVVAFDEDELEAMLSFFGFETNIKSFKPSKVSKLELPALCYARDGSLVIIGKIESNTALVQGSTDESPRQIDIGELCEYVTGRAAEAKKTKTLQAGDTTTPKFGIGWFVSSIKKHKTILSEVLLASLFVQIFALLTPLVFQVVIDKVLTNRALSTLDVMVGALVAITVFEAALGGIRHYIFSHTANRVDLELSSKLFTHILRLPLSYFNSRRSGDTVARVRELDNARNFLMGSALTGWLDLVFAIVFLAVMFYYSPTLTVIVLLALPIFFGASFVVTPILRQKLEDKFALGAENQAFLVETVTAMEAIKSSAVEQKWQKEWMQRITEYSESTFAAGHTASVTNQFIGFVSKILTAVLLWFGAKLVIGGDLTVGGLIAFNMLAGRVNAPILKLSSIWQDFTQMKVSISRLADIMDAGTEGYHGFDRTAPAPIDGTISFESVSFRYKPNAPEILNNISFDIKRGEIIGLVGVSGSGKTTVMRLLQRLYTPQSGRILIDGADINTLDASWLRKQIGIAAQDAVLFNRSVRENISLGSQSADITKITEAAKLAGAHDFIIELPEGYDTPIGERGALLSGGQRARIAIARALFNNPKILLLDEATAMLDYEAEFLIHDKMTDICKGKTVVIAAHRLSTLRLTDRILVLDRGKVIEEGNHTELMALGGKYAALYKAHGALESKTKGYVHG